MANSTTHTNAGTDLNDGTQWTNKQLADTIWDTLASARNFIAALGARDPKDKKLKRALWHAAEANALIEEWTRSNELRSRASGLRTQD